ncbi:MAG TPA: prolipoprotein diacylglyceryl transferase family protein [Gemmatimonadaceae bacterium]|nr:prolipoprotein diacylglyceryl transferase family protein [Gemmatimonadaceae bacterium]
MRPILLHVGTYVIYSHVVFVALGAVVALATSWRMAARVGRANQDFLIIIAGGFVGAAILARYGLVFRYLSQAHDPSVRGFLDYGAKSLLAGLAGAYAGVVITKRLIGYRRQTGDLIIPGAALGIAIGRVGCFLAERPGTVTTLPWGVRVPPDAAARIPDCPACASGAAMHPSFLYEAAFLAVAAWLLFRITKRPALPAAWMREGDTFKAFLLAYGVFRFFVELVRGSPEMALGMSGSQLTVLPGIAALALYFIRSRRAHRVALAAVPA